MEDGVYYIGRLQGLRETEGVCMGYSILYVQNRVFSRV